MQKFGGPEYYGGMKKESKFIIDMHKDLFFCTPKALSSWMDLFKEAVEEQKVRN
jgi:hypothetical protein